MQLSEFAQTRPFLYHLTARANLKRIRRDQTLYPASTLIERAGRHGLLRVHRNGKREVTIDNESLIIRDQNPLKKGNCSFAPGFTFGDLIELINRHVFFWPGSEHAPVPSGRNYLKPYADDDVAVLQIPTQALLAANQHSAPKVCRYNSGAPRCHPKTGKSPRGPDLFVAATDFEEPPKKIVELVFESPVRIPAESLLDENFFTLEHDA